MRNLKLAGAWGVAAIVLTAAFLFSLHKTSTQTQAATEKTNGYSSYCPNGYVALSFDDGPDPVTTPRALEYLRKNHLHATFFVLGMKVQEHPELVRQILAEGHAIGVHTWDHHSLTGKSTNKAPLSMSEIEQEISSTKDVIIKETKTTPVLWRPPYGDTTPAIAKMVKDKYAMTEVGWTVSSRDTFKLSADEIYTNTMKLVDGGTVLSHDTVANSVEAIPYIATGLVDRGLCAGRLTTTQFAVKGWYAGPYYARPIAP